MRFSEHVPADAIGGEQGAIRQALEAGAGAMPPSQTAGYDYLLDDLQLRWRQDAHGGMRPNLVASKRISRCIHSGVS